MKFKTKTAGIIAQSIPSLFELLDTDSGTTQKWLPESSRGLLEFLQYMALTMATRCYLRNAVLPGLEAKVGKWSGVFKNWKYRGDYPAKAPELSHYSCISYLGSKNHTRYVVSKVLKVI